MFDRKKTVIRRNIGFTVTVILGLFTAPDLSKAEDFTAGVLMKRMDTAEKAAFISGVVEGLAAARYVQDGKNPKGRSCIYRWLYDDKKTMGKIYEAFERHPNELPGRIIQILSAKACGG